VSNVFDSIITGNVIVNVIKFCIIIFEIKARQNFVLLNRYYIKI